jgi:hypothetical protein
LQLSHTPAGSLDGSQNPPPESAHHEPHRLRQCSLLKALFSRVLTRIRAAVPALRKLRERPAQLGDSPVGRPVRPPARAAPHLHTAQKDDPHQRWNTRLHHDRALAAQNSCLATAELPTCRPECMRASSACTPGTCFLFRRATPAWSASPLSTCLNRRSDVSPVPPCASRRPVSPGSTAMEAEARPSRAGRGGPRGPDGGGRWNYGALRSPKTPGAAGGRGRREGSGQAGASADRAGFSRAPSPQPHHGKGLTGRASLVLHLTWYNSDLISD